MEFIDKISELVEKVSGKNRHPARNAIHHLDMAEKIKEIDKNMSIFRLITAEEEAATSLFLELKTKGYKGADAIKHRDHVHKNALYPFLRSLQMALTDLKVEQYEPAIQIARRNNKEIVNIRMLAPNDELKRTVTFDPPLEFELKEENGGFLNLQPFYNKIAEDKKHSDVIKWLENEANLRNKVLYASEKGIPSIQANIDGIIKNRKARVTLILSIYLMIEPYREKQIFVQNCLDEYLKMVKRVPKI